MNCPPPTTSERCALDPQSICDAFDRLPIPPDVTERALALLADDLSLAIAVAGNDFGRRLHSALQALYGGSAGISLGPVMQGFPAPESAFLLGSLIHSVEQDDTHVPSIVHGGAVLIPAALVAAVSHRCTGAQLLRSLVLGWELLIRLGLHAPGAFQARGFQVSAVLGPIAAAIVAGWLQGLKADQLRHAIGIALSFSAGPLTYLENGAESKKLHLGWAARSGLVAAQLAAAGITGPSDVVGSSLSVYELFAASKPVVGDGLLGDLGQRWHLREVSFKAWPCCHYLQGFIEAMEALRLEAGSRALQSLHLHVPEQVAPLLCLPIDRRNAPSTDIDARFSLPYVVKALLLDGAIDASTFDASARARINGSPWPLRMTWEPWQESGFPQCYPARVDATVEGGSRLHAEVRSLRGGPDRPFMPQELMARFFERTEPRLGKQAAAALWQSLATLETSESIEL
ncbi:MAG: MmgE/PrpD family protein [Betaproteobacteria bacterium]